MIIALTGFDALVGFRQYSEIDMFLKLIPELNSLFNMNCTNKDDL